MSVALKSLLLALVLGLCVPNALASGLRGAHESSKEVVEDVETDEDLQSRRKLPPGQPNYGLTPSEHQNLYGYVDPAGYYGNYGYYDGGDYARFTYGNPWGDPNWYQRYSRPSGGGQSSWSQNNYNYQNSGNYQTSGYYQNGYYYQNGNYYQNSNSYNGPYNSNYYRRYGRGRRYNYNHSF